MKQTKPRIIQTLVQDNGKIVNMVIKDIVKPHGGSGYVAIPKELIGKQVTIIYDAEATQTAKEKK